MQKVKPFAVRGVLIGVVLVAFLFGSRVWLKNSKSASARRQGVAFLQNFPQYEVNNSYYDVAFDEMHGLAFEQAYRHRSKSIAKFDKTKYQAALVALYQRRAAEDGKSEIARALEQHRKSLNLPLVDLE
jgi:hypothetical protein